MAEIAAASATATTLTVTERREICASIARDPEEDATARIAATIAEAKHAQEFTERSEITDKTPKEPLGVLRERRAQANAARLAATHGRS